MNALAREVLAESGLAQVDGKKSAYNIKPNQWDGSG